MTLSFDAAFDNSIKNEGGLRVSTLDHDSGGQTCAGIARNYHPEWSGWPLLDSGVLPTDQRIVDLIKQFYLTEYWMPLQAENMPPRIAAQIFDFAINANCERAIKAAQRAVGVNDDGDVGAQTIGALRRADPDKFVARYAAQKLRFYTTRTGWPNFGEGWANRIATQLERGVE